MVDMRHRDGKVKVMHTIIGDFGRVLREIATLDEVESILTGTIAPSKSYKESLTFQYFTDNGLKLLAKTTIAVQEIFIVTAVPDLLLDELQKMRFIQSEREDVKHGAAGKRNKKMERARKAHTATQSEGEDHASAQGSVAHNRRPGTNTGAHPKAGTGAPNTEADPLTLRQRLHPDALAALMKVKEEITPKERAPIPSASGANTPRANAKANERGNERNRKKNFPARSESAEEEDFASLFLPQDEEESFEQLFNKSKLDPKFFK